MSWLHHPSYISAREGLITTFTSRSHVFKKLKRVMFLGGAANSGCRSSLEEYLGKHRTDTLVFRAEDVWVKIAHSKKLNALEMERQLAQLADIVAIIVESPGTFAELGAFSLSPELREKLLPIVESKYKDDTRSFIRTGPISWIEQTSRFAPPIYADFSVILESVNEIEERLDRIRIKGKHEVTNLATSPKHLLFLVCDLLAVIGPAPLEHVAFYVSRILGEEPGYDIASLLSLAEAIGILRTFQSLNGVVFYCRPLSNGQLYSFTYLKEGLNLSVERAKHLNAMQRIQAARAVIRLVGRL